ncbi:MAG TPA: hypothetical protein VHW73_05055 [Rudaea sp.]|jgi:hypothetical protein|nr:hypothetical protein [Rudaea sp.]
MHSHRGSDQMRRRVAVEAARLMSESGIRDFQVAKRKAAERLGAHDKTQLPNNAEIDDALREHQRLFQSDEHPQILRRLREEARDAMKFFKDFEPRLVGPVLEGTADKFSAVCLHLFCDTPEQVMILLDENRIPYEERNRKLKFAPDKSQDYPALIIPRDDIHIDITLLPPDDIRRSPLDRVDDKPMKRATLGVIEDLLKE